MEAKCDPIGFNRTGDNPKSVAVSLHSMDCSLSLPSQDSPCARKDLTRQPQS